MTLRRLLYFRGHIATGGFEWFFLTLIATLQLPLRTYFWFQVWMPIGICYPLKQEVDPMLVLCWASVVDGGPA